MQILSENIRNIAIIAHVDHGKTTLVDAMLKQAGVFRENQEFTERIMDSNSLEKERGITILAKNTSIKWKDHKINIIDTPGHADFGGEVERILSMVDGVALLVDASEGVMPQTKFVLGKAFKLGLKPIVIVNKIDRPDKRVSEVLDEILDLFIHLDATDEQLNYPVFYGSGRDGWLSPVETEKRDDLSCVFDKILEYIPSPKIINDDKVRFLGTILGHDPFVGRLLTGKLYSGSIKVNQSLKGLNDKNEFIENFKISRIQVSNGITRDTVQEGIPGDIITISGFTKVSVSDTICDVLINEGLKAVPIDPPTISIGIGANSSPFAGKEGSKVTSSLIKDRLAKEAETNVSIKIEEDEDGNFTKVSGRGELQLGILIENMRREGFELCVSKPKVLFKEEGGKKLEPIEELTVDVATEHSNVVIKTLNLRKAEMIDMRETGANQTRIVFLIPTRGLIGCRNKLLSDTKGTIVMNSIFHSYQEHKGVIDTYRNGVLISNDKGPATAFALWGLQERGVMFISPQEEVYEGMIVGENSKDNDLDVNVIKGKQLTNVRASGSDEAIKLIPAKKLTLEDMISYINKDELLEITPKNLRLRKKELNPSLRRRNSNLNE